MRPSTIGVLILIVLATGLAGGYCAGKSTMPRDRAERSLVTGIMSMPSYRAQAAVASGFSLASQMKVMVAEAYQETGRLPSSKTEARVPDDFPPPSPYVASIGVGADGVITVTYKGNSRIAGKTLELAPIVTSSGYMTWKCTGGTLASSDRPEPCRAP